MDNAEYYDAMINAAVRQLADDRQPLTSSSLFNLLVGTLANRLQFAITNGRFFALNSMENSTEILLNVEALRQTRSVLIGSVQTMLVALMMSVTEIFQSFGQGPDYIDLFRFLKLTYRTELDDVEFQRLFDFSLAKMKNDQTVEVISGRFVFKDFGVSQSESIQGRSAAQAASSIPTSLTSVSSVCPNNSSPVADRTILSHVSQGSGLSSRGDGFGPKDPVSPASHNPLTNTLSATASPGSSVTDHCDSGRGSRNSMADPENSNPATSPAPTSTLTAVVTPEVTTAHSTSMEVATSSLPQPVSSGQCPLLANPINGSPRSLTDHGAFTVRASNNSMALSGISSVSENGPGSLSVDKTLSAVSSTQWTNTSSMDEDNGEYRKKTADNHAASKGIRRNCGKQMKGTLPTLPRGGYKLFIKMKNNGFITKEALESAFSPYGKIKDVHMPDGKRFALVTFDTLEAADRAGSMLNGRVINDVKISCEWADSQEGSRVSDGGTREQRRALKRPQPEQLMARDYSFAEGQDSGFRPAASEIHNTPPSRGLLQRTQAPLYHQGQPTHNRSLQEQYYEQHTSEIQFTPPNSSNQYASGRCTSLHMSNEWRGDLDKRTPFHVTSHFPQQPHHEHRQGLIPDPPTAPSNILPKTFFSRVTRHTGNQVGYEPSSNSYCVGIQQPLLNHNNPMSPRGNMNGQGPQESDCEFMQRMSSMRPYVSPVSLSADPQASRVLSKRRVGNGFVNEADDWRAGRR